MSLLFCFVLFFLIKKKMPKLRRMYWKLHIYIINRIYILYICKDEMFTPGCWTYINKINKKAYIQRWTYLLILVVFLKVLQLSMTEGFNCLYLLLIAWLSLTHYLRASPWGVFTIFLLWRRRKKKHQKSSESNQRKRKKQLWIS